MKNYQSLGKGTPQVDQNIGQNSGTSQPKNNYAFSLLFTYLDVNGIHPDKHNLTKMDGKKLALKLNALTIRTIVIGKEVDTTLQALQIANVQIEHMREKLQNDKYPAPTINYEFYQQSTMENLYGYLDKMGINPEKHQISLLKKEELYFKMNGMIIKALLMAKDLDKARQALEEARDQIKELKDELNANK